ncbi:GNAT family N-acetyltransferase [Aquimarina litoralis]|uniref:GNAT family N-acetyltransferase n=1 Tax=Aquimarina litoralis TaxID=584605 RepID=UPI001C55A5F5|nr:GNAT family N-acetyltransferase [Aquimarina litoralis]MBW1295194.1 GNAT family N-acetyltransferase [Aquimarina litoralis]
MQYIIDKTKLPDVEEIRVLFLQTSWAKDRTIESIRKLLENTEIFVVIRNEETNQLIGFGRAISDGVFRALLDDIVIDTNYRKKGLGKCIVENLLQQLGEVEQVFLNTKPELEPFYHQFGFTKSKAVSMSL